MSGPWLVGDVGGTGVRLGWVEAAGDPVTRVRRADAAARRGIGDEIEAYLAAERLPRPAAVALGVAGPVDGDAVAFTNRDEAFSRRALQAALGVERLLVLNDFAALAHGLAVLAPGDAVAVGPHDWTAAPADAPCALLGPGTGLGVAGLLRGAGGSRVVAGEGGHATLAGTGPLEDAVIARVRARHGRASAESVLSGDGLETLWRALAEVEGRTADGRAAAAITAGAREGDAACRRVLDLFFAFLGHVAGDLALVLGARGGVFVGGGIVPRLGDAIDRSPFRACFEAKGGHAAWMAGIPTARLVDPAALALRGAAAALAAER